MPEAKQIAFAFSMVDPHNMHVVSGIADYAREHGPWNFFADFEGPVLSLRSLKGWPGDGIIAMIETSAEARAARDMHIPVINISGAMARSTVPRVMVDQLAIGQLAAEHLLARHFQHFAYYGLRGVYYSRVRQEGYVSRVRQNESTCSVFEASSSIATRRPWRKRTESLETWLKTLKPPVGVFAVHDMRASMVMDACAAVGLRVPEDVAVLGVDNQETICNLSRVPISSVSRNDRQIGYQAAALLDRLMARKRPPKRDKLIPPEGVFHRKSTDVLAIDDPEVASAVRHIDHHATEEISVDTVVQHLPVSRRWLEYRFQEYLGCTPHEYICRARVEQAKKLLTSRHKLRLHQIASACGFTDTRHLRTAFKRITGVTPAEYRRGHLVLKQAKGDG